MSHPRGPSRLCAEYGNPQELNGGNADQRRLLTLPRRIPSTVADVHSVLFGPEPDQIRTARSWAWRSSGLGYDHADSLLLVLSELHTNALRHTASGLPGGTVRVDLERLPDRGFRVSVTDQGPRPGAATTVPTPASADLFAGLVTEESGRGLDLVAALSRDWGWHRDDSGPGVTVWAEVDRPGRWG
ncbi:ATP-binding protein [Streptomonospora nanhaiensis]|uniref:Anti-sigma regulatory factor (Ser/Thr protein kinase) n=1 Tax=Streptomonospora nanhaiensis TaxID=1323731 RepID=A0A853BUV8_9ACTN|nr:ATP-binding protein [Streptomonospora nanhaiensis]NYI98297.1 anti-sigma regulatory factor (Ser/Thr protein kinase) [Streptomonospora nanhaiensis]